MNFFEKKNPFLVADLHSHLSESTNLIQAMKTNLKGLGYGV